MGTDSLASSQEILPYLLEAALNNGESAILIVNQCGELAFANSSAERLFGFSLAEARGKMLTDILPFIPEPEIITLRALREQRRVEVLRSVYELPCGKRTLLRSADVFFGTAGEILGAITCITDVTDLEEEENRNRTREKLALIGQMAAGMAHELRNPMTVVSGFAQLMLKRVNQEPEAGYLRLIVEELNHTAKLIDDFLLLARPADPQLQELKAYEFLEQMRLLIESQCLLNEVELRINCPPDITIWGDPDQLRQVLLNIVKNSLEAMQERVVRILSIKVEPHRKGQVKIIISDSGSGIDKNDLTKVGTPFFTNKAKGTGLGLSLSIKLVERMGGHLFLESTYDIGTVVTITLNSNHTT